MLIGEPYIPWRLFHGAFIPNWLLERRELSQGAKLCFARLGQFGGVKGNCHPGQQVLADSLGVVARQARKYVAELEAHGLIVSTRKGLGKSNSYTFIWHPWSEEHLENVEVPSNEELKFPSTKELKDLTIGTKVPLHYIDKRIIKRINGTSPNGDGVSHTEFIRLWSELYQQQFGRAYSFCGGKDGAAVKRLLNSTGKTPEELVAAATRAWGRAEFNCEKAVSIAGFAGRYNEIMAELEPNENKHEANRQISEKRVDRNIGNANEGRAHLYAGIGRLPKVV
jgi:hypothetical protein